MIRGCIFDLDGTLVNSLDDLCNSCNYLLEKYHFPIHEREKYNLFVGNGIKKLLQRAFPHNCEMDFDCLLDEFNNYYEEHLLDCTVPYKGIMQLIQQLKKENIIISIVTNKPDLLAKKIVNYFFGNDINIIYGSSIEYPSKPDPTSLCLALSDMNLRSDECLFIGDSDVDVFTGHNANMKTIGVTWGFRGKEELLNAQSDYVVETPREIMEIIYENRD